MSEVSAMNIEAKTLMRATSSLFVVFVAFSVGVTVGFFRPGASFFERPPRPLFFNVWRGDPETGRYGWSFEPGALGMSNGDLVHVDYDRNILMVARAWGNSMAYGSSSDPGPEHQFLEPIVELGKSVRVPIWRNSAIVYDKTGALRI
jgi:hypothetical protein